VHGNDKDGSDGDGDDKKRPRVNVNQAEVQKRYRERKKDKMVELEKTVDDLRAKVRELEHEKELREIRQVQQQEALKHKLVEQQLQALQWMHAMQQEHQQERQQEQRQQEQQQQQQLLLLQQQPRRREDERRRSTPSTSPSDVDDQQREGDTAGGLRGASVDPPGAGSYSSDSVGSVLHRHFTVIGAVGGGARSENDSPVSPPTVIINAEDMASILAAARSATNTASEFEDGSSDDTCEMAMMKTALEYTSEYGATVERGGGGGGGDSSAEV
jgi:flagellar biosynthesis GTPase FlhF